MNNNIEFKIISNDERTKFQIEYNAKVNGSSITKVFSREFGSPEAAQEYLNKNREILIKKISETLPKEIVEEKVPVEDENKEEIETEVVVENEISSEEIVTGNTEEVIEDEASTEENENSDNENEVSEEEQTEEPEEELTDDNIIDVEDYEPISEEGMVPRNTKKRHLTKKILAAISALALVCTLGRCACQSNNLDGNDEEPGLENPDKENEEPVLTTEVFNDLTDKFTKILEDKNILNSENANVTETLTKADVIKFVAIANMDRLVTDNPELAKELFASLTREEYIQDAANVIARIYQHNSKTFELDGNTQNFVRVSDALIGSSKEQLVIIESYEDRIAEVSYDREQANNIIAELIVRLSYLEVNHGTTFAMQVSIETIRSSIARNLLYTETGKLTDEEKAFNDAINNNIDSLLKLTRVEYKSYFEMYDNVQGIETKTRTLK